MPDQDEIEPDPPPRIETIGPDRVEVRADRVVIHSPVDMERWDVVEYRKPIIQFQGRVWTLVEKKLAEDGWLRYELVPRDPEDFDLPGHELHYGVETVEAREEERRREGRIELETILLRLLSPLAGFLFARTKDRLEERTGITAAAMTARSLFLEYLIIVCAAIYTTLGVMSGAASLFMTAKFAEALGGVPLTMFLPIALLPDAIVRWGRLLAEEREQPGLYEWLWLSPKRYR